MTPHRLRHVPGTLLAVLVVAAGQAACGDGPTPPPGSANIDLGVTLSASAAEANPGDTVTYTVTITNHGPVAASSVFGGDTLPTGSTYASHTVSGGTYDGATGLWTVGDLAVGASLTLTLLSVVNNDFLGDLENGAGVTSADQADTNLANNVALTTVSVVTEFPPPPPGVDEPFFDAATGVMMHVDSMDQYASAHDMWLDLNNGPPRFRQEPFGEDSTGAILLSPGRGGSGKALRMSYLGNIQEGHGWDLNFMPATLDTATHYFQYWARATFASPLGTSALAVKWFMAFHPTGDRVQFNTHDHLPCPAEASGIGTYWQVYDKSLETTCQANQPIGPYPQEIFDGQWHRYTYQYRPNSAPGSRDGIARMWVDGVKIIDISQPACGTTPTGGYKTWCELDDLDGLTTDGVNLLRFGSTQTTATPAWTLDIDDFVWWRAK